MVCHQCYTDVTNQVGSFDDPKRRGKEEKQGILGGEVIIIIQVALLHLPPSKNKIIGWNGDNKAAISPPTTNDNRLLLMVRPLTFTHSPRMYSNHHEQEEEACPTIHSGIDRHDYDAIDD